MRRIIPLLVIIAACRHVTAAAGEVDHDLFTFVGAEPAKGWWLNIWGRNAAGEKGRGRIEVVQGLGRAAALKLSLDHAGSSNFVSPDVPDGEWRQRRYSAVEVWYRGNGAKEKMRFVVETKDPDTGKGHTYSDSLFLGDPDWQRVELRSFWRREGTPDLDLSRIRRILIAGNGVKSVVIGRVRLLAAGQSVALRAIAAPPPIVVAPLQTSPEVDGDLSDAAWRPAAIIDGLRVFDDQPHPSAYSTRVQLGYHDGTLYMGARLRGEKPDAIHVRWNDDEAPVWQDSSLELYLDPGATHVRGYQLVVNAAGARLDIGEQSRSWNGRWQAAVKRDARDGWSAEIAVDLTTFGETPAPGAVWGLNVKRHVVGADGKMVEVSGWSQGTPQPVSGYGAAVFGPPSPLKVHVDDIRMRRVSDDESVVDVDVRLEETAPQALRVVARLFPPDGKAPAEGAVRTGLPGRARETVTLRVPHRITQDGVHRLAVTVRDSRGLVVDHDERALSLSRPVEVHYDDVVLWPPPQKMETKPGAWVLPDTIRIGGPPNTFPLEHLAERLRLRYGVDASLTREGESGNIQARLIPSLGAERFGIDVDGDGIRLSAGDERGLYYAVRALLDVITQSSMGDSPAQCRWLHIEDGPAVKRRVLYHVMGDYYRVSKGVQCYKDFIYDQVAGGRYNLLILNMRNGLRYESHPELPTASAFTREELREIIDFARRHYVDVAPAGNSPGHAGWLCNAHPELREDGDRNTLCTRHPDAVKFLKEIYGEELDLFRPARYFHLGGDEVRWQTAATPEEKRCPRCRGVEKRELLLEFWREMIDFVRQRGATPILWEDMLSERWNGGAPYNTALILPKLPHGVIIASWTTKALINPPALYRKLHLVPWKINTSFAPGKMEDMLSWWRDYDAVGLGEFTSWPWCNFVHFDTRRHCNYSTPAIHCNAACNWKPETSTIGWNRLVATHGPHWMKVMHTMDWRTRRLTYEPQPLDAICNASTRDDEAGDGQGWLDLGSDHDLRGLPGGDFAVGAIPFRHAAGGRDCVLLSGQETSKPLPIGRPVRGLALLHTLAVDAAQVKPLQQRFFRQNREHYGMTVARYRVRYADGSEALVPIKIGWNAHRWNCYPPARIMPGARAFWSGLTQHGRRTDPRAPDVAVWAAEWLNPNPQKPVADVTLSAAGTECQVAWLALTVVE